MEHVAIDLGGRRSFVCARTADGKITLEKEVATSELQKFMTPRPESRVVLEACAEAFHIADQMLELGHEVRVVPGRLVRMLGVGDRQMKTDRRDAQALSEVSCRIDLPSVHIPTAMSRQWKSLCGLREGLVRSRTACINGVRGWLRTKGLRPRTGATTTLAERVRELVAERPREIERHLETIEFLCKQIKEADDELEALATSHPVCRRLTTVPGVGPVTAVRFVAALDEISRFAGPHKVEAYLGLTPGERSSGEKQRRTGITKAGSSDVRRTLIQAAWAARRTRQSQPMLDWCIEVERRRGKMVAVTALARKLAGILYALWRDGSVYQSHRSAGVQLPT